MLLVKGKAHGIVGARHTVVQRLKSANPDFILVLLHQLAETPCPTPEFFQIDKVSRCYGYLSSKVESRKHQINQTTNLHVR